jgi:predicted ArsR family transcriptional regulator
MRCLRALEESGDYPGRWKWGTHSLTVRILDSLVVRGLVERTETARVSPDTGRPAHSYKITDAGKEELR